MRKINGFDARDPHDLDREAHALHLRQNARINLVVERHVRRMRSDVGYGRRADLGAPKIAFIVVLIRVRGGDSAEQCAHGHGQRGHGLTETSHDIPFS